jgi:tetratricopeptide (TPR) repeat protein
MKTPIMGVILAGLLAPAAFSQDLDRAIELYRKNNYSESESILRKIVEQQGDNARANRYLGLALVEQNKPAEAEPFLRKADELESNADTKAALARLYVQQKEYDKAEAAIKEAGGDEAPYVRGLLHLQRKRYEEAARELEAYTESHPDHAYAHYYAGMAYNALKRPDKMINHFEMFLQLKPDAPEARKVRSVVRSAQ